ncbi:MAG: peptidase penicillin amidase [Gemmatimonadetes bacterium]|nr:peptidase penicillin amidase [Gemmatimonadota bacterium]
MRKLILLALLAGCAKPAPMPEVASSADVSRWQAQAARVTITRDDWGIAHVHGRSDADAVFGMVYAQAEDDFNRVETNYLTSLGRMAESEGAGVNDSLLFQDLRMKLFIDPDTLKEAYSRSPGWLQALMNGWADGLNYYMYTHRAVKPRVITHYEPWMALSFSEGSIGGDIETVKVSALGQFYGGAPARGDAPASTPPPPSEPSGSNGFAIAPQNSATHHALLLINPHTSFYFRSELQVSSDEGLNAYGAVTWGQFFVYQGFNARAGWMHTSTGADVIDEFAETVTKTGAGYSYRYGSEERPVRTQRITVAYRTDTGMASRSFEVFRTHHGPVVRSEGGKWIAVSLMNKPADALAQSFLRTKAHDYTGFRFVAELKGNSSNNTLYADADGTIAYFHPHFIPQRDDRFDYTRAVDGSDPATDWKGLTPIESAPFLKNPASGWLYNSNDAPWSAGGVGSLKREAFPRYMDTHGVTPRGLHAVRVLSDRHDFTLQSLIGAAYDSYLPGFARLVPSLVAAYDGAPASDSMKVRLAEPLEVMRAWDYRWSASSVATSLAVLWGEELFRRTGHTLRSAQVSVFDSVAAQATREQQLASLAVAVDRLTRDFGGWRTPWGDVNRFQRLTDDLVHPFRDDAPSIPVPFTSANWGSLASFAASRYKDSKHFFGTSGNSFVAVVQFGDSVRAMAVTAGGESGDPRSRHFNDQATRYASGNLREVYFYPSQLVGHTERTYHPGQ